MPDFIEADYLFPTGIDAQKQAQTIAVGQTAGSWGAHWESRADSFRTHLAEVVSIKEAEGGNLATIRFPLHNTENDIGSLLTMAFGKYSLAGTGKLMAIRLPETYGLHPKFGISGLRNLTGVHDRPFVMGIFKPALGLSAEDHAAILREVAFAGIDLIKDDEILGDLPSCPVMERLAACRNVIEDARQKTGRNILYAVNVTGRADQLLERAKRLVAEGASALLLNVFTYGFSILESLAASEEIAVPIFVHPAFAGAMQGASYPVLLGTLPAYAGADAVLYPAHYGSLPFAKEDEFAIRDLLRTRNVLPVPSAGIHPGIVPQVIKDYGKDVALNAGTGIMDHAQGPAAGVNAMFEALDA